MTRPIVSENSIPVPAPGVVARIMDGEAVLVHPERGEVKVVNALGARIWAWMDGERTVSHLVELICETYDVEGETARADAIRFLGQLCDRELIEFAESKGP